LSKIEWMGGDNLSTQEQLQNVIYHEMSDEEVRETLLDITLLLSNIKRTPKDTISMFEEIYKSRIYDKYIDLK
jgi:hypothetical protein